MFSLVSTVPYKRAYSCMYKCWSIMPLKKPATYTQKLLCTVRNFTLYNLSFPVLLFWNTGNSATTWCPGHQKTGQLCSGPCNVFRCFGGVTNAGFVTSTSVLMYRIEEAHTQWCICIRCRRMPSDIKINNIQSVLQKLCSNIDPWTLFQVSMGNTLDT